LLLRKTRQSTIVTLAIGTFRAHERILCCPECTTDYRCEELLRLKPSGARFGYDVVVFVGEAMFLRCCNEQQIRQELHARRVIISEREIAYLARKFIVYLSLAHRQSRRRIKQLMEQNGGYILHLDATCEGDSPHLMSGLDGISELVLENTKLSSEKAELIAPFLRQIKARYGSPLALVHDMGAGIGNAVKEVFPQSPDFICHYHFLADVGKDLFATENDTIRRRLRKHGIQGKLHKRLRQWQPIIQQNPNSVASLVDSVKTGRLPQQDAADLMPTITAYTLVLWALAGKKQGDGYGFPFDRPYLEFYLRLPVLHAELRRLYEAHRSTPQPTKPYTTILRDLLETLDDRTLLTAVIQMQQKTAVFDKLREALRIAAPAGKHGLNDRGSQECIITIEQRVKAFRTWLLSDESLAKKPEYQALIGQLEQYWDRLFCDPIRVQTPHGPLLIQPQRTNNVLEQFFRGCKRDMTKKSGTGRIARTLKAMIANTPLVRNLRDLNYRDIILDGKPSLEERFALIEIQTVRKELIAASSTPEEVPPKIRKLIKNPGLPAILVALFTRENQKSNRPLRS
jgi:hypothetical protein